MSVVKVGDFVLCHGLSGKVLFVGETEFSPGEWVGVELEKPRGKNDGSVDGVKYFTTKENYGVFVPGKSPALQVFDEKVAAAIKVQSLVRKKHALQKSRTNDLEQEKETFKAWDSLDRLHEQEALKHNAMSSQVQQILKISGAQPHIESSKKQFRALKSSAQLELPGSRQDYSRDFCEMLVRKAKKLKQGETVVRADMVQQILYHFTLLMDEKSECMNKIKTPELGNLIVVGDTHGQLEDLLWIFFKHGLPSRENVYLFNGDITDRGPQAVCLWVILLAFKLHDTEIIQINRGNHEDDSMNNSYGFLDELTNKFGDRGFDLYRNFQYIFCTLPLFTVIDDKILVLHAGLPRQAKYLKLSQLAAVDHRRPIPDRPRVGEDTLFFDAMWSDPSSKLGTESNTRGPDVVSWGPDLTSAFLKQNNLVMVIRSHQVPTTLQGYEWHHDQQVLTIFSASNYCGVSGNQGAVAIIRRGLEKPSDVKIIEHWAPDWDSAIEHLILLEKDTEKATQVVRMEAINIIEARQGDERKKETRTQIEEEITAEAKPLIVQRKKELFQYWSVLDTDQDLHITLAQWREGCAALCDENLPWKKLQQSLGLVQPGKSAKDQLVPYVVFLQRFRIGFCPAPNMPEVILGWEERVCEDLYLALIRADLSVDATFAVIDHNRDGTVGWDELKRLLESSCSHSITSQQAQHILRSLGARENANVNLLQFLDKLRLTFRRTHLPSCSEEDAWIPTALDKLSLVILKDAQKRFADVKLKSGVRRGSQESSSSGDATLHITRWFEDADANDNGYLTFPELFDAINRLPKAEVNEIFKIAGGCNEKSVRALMNYCGVNRTGYLNYLEFIEFLSFVGEDKAPSCLNETSLDTVCAGVYFHTLAIKQAVRYFHPQGMITPDDFMQALQAVSTAYASTSAQELFTTQQASILANTPHVDENGKMNALAFLASFRLIDTRPHQ
eukprot:GEMP01001225.1.p1 GENE.GEMP01001225.1~~GEMP01001225.1.p1  ORF type:complete len:1013 (+),score=166.81 GEMP01001225.1:176-3040(+)